MFKEKLFSQPEKNDNKSPEQEKSGDKLGFMSMINNSKTMKGVRAMIAGAMLFTAAAAKSAENSEDKLNQKNSQTEINKAKRDRLPFQSVVGDGVSDRKLEWPGLHFTFTEKDENGNPKFNPWSILAPLQLELSREISEQNNASFKLPYEYSRLFEAGKEVGKPLREEDHEKMAAYIDNLLKQNFADMLHGFDMNKRIYKTHHGEKPLEKARVSDVRITGTASPEGPKEKGPETIKPENIDEENIRLAEKRGGAAAQVLLERLKNYGANQTTIAKAVEAAENVQAKEIQFNDDELRDLSNLATAEKGFDDIERIYNLILKYNENKITDPYTLEELDRIVAAKRGVEITISYEGNKKQVVLIPIPLIPFLLIPLLRRRRRDEAPTPPTLPRKDIIYIPKKITETKLPEKDSADYEKMEEAALIDDLYLFIDDPAAIKRGLDYRMMADTVVKNNKKFSNDEQKELYLTKEMLRAWKKHDRKSRRDADIPYERLDDGLDYEKQEKQIIWARMHARELVKLINKKIDDPRQNYLESAAPDMRRFMRRRILREAK